MPATPSHPSRTARRIALVGVAAIVAACGTSPTPAPATAGSPSPSAESVAPSQSPSSPDLTSIPPSGAPGASASPAASATPVPTVSPSPQPGSADACSGTAENRDFYAALAASVAWDVYCPVLPAGWFVERCPNCGSYRLANGGQLSITYRGPDGARLVIREGNYCAGQPDCGPTGTDAGGAHFGERDARLVDLGDGTWLVSVTAETPDIGWQATGSGMDGPTLAGYTAAFARVDH